MARRLLYASEMTSRIQLFDLRFTSKATLGEAFARVQQASWVESCTLESNALRMQFVARDATASALTQRIYLNGGLRWCSAHPLRRDDAR